MIDYQDLEDRIASLERTTRNIGVGQELVVGSLHALNTVTAADVVMQRPIYDIRAFGAVGDNSADDTTPIQDAIDAAYADSAGGVVLVPPLGSGANDRYKITSALDWKGGVCFLGAGYYSRISAHVSNSAFPVIQSHTSMELGVWMKGLTLGFEDYYDDVLAKCIFFRTQDSTIYPEMFTLEDVTLRNGYYGYYDSSAGFLGHLRRVWAYKNRVGFHKSGGGTGHHFTNCYAGGKADKTWDMRGFDISDGVSYVLEACSMDDYYSDTDAIARFADNHSLTINGFVMERDRAETAGNSIVQFDDNNSVHVTGMKDVTCIINAAAGDNTRLIAVHEDRVHFSGCELGGGTSVVAAGATTEGYAIDITGAADDVCRVTVTASAIADPAALPTRTATTISFDSATKEIRDSAEGLNRFATGLAITVSGSTDNDGAYTIATGGVGAKIVVNEALTDEAAGASVTVEITDLPDVYAIRLGTAVNTVELTLDNVEEGTILNANKNVVTRPRAGEGHITILGPSYVSVGQGTWAISADAGSYLGWNFVNGATHADGDNVSYKVYLDAGTYTLLFHCYTNDQQGVIDFDIDATEVASFDNYASPTVSNVRKTQASIVIGEAGLKTLKVEVDGKNASSSNHYCTFRYIALWRTA